MTVVCTIGHSTRTIEDFLGLLRREGVRALVDVRAFPMSRRYPHFNREALARTLDEQGIEYTHAPSLGGRRRPQPASKSTAWRNESFRAYADHMATSVFRRALDAVIANARRTPTTIMCAEAVPWRCHRGLISDALVAQGCEVRHVLDAGTQLHTLTAFARIVGPDVTYPSPRETAPEQAELLRRR
ncbi:MAG: DUF488 domain-containing protein [Gemmatimonadaceae bacterium]